MNRMVTIRYGNVSLSREVITGHHAYILERDASGYKSISGHFFKRAMNNWSPLGFEHNTHFLSKSMRYSIPSASDS